MNTQEKAWRTRKLSLCVVCKSKPKRSEKAKTCNQHCAGKLAWETRGSQ